MTAGARAEKIRSYEDLDVYRRGFALLKPIHALVQQFPKYEAYALADQMRRASRSVPTNIAEGYSRRQSPKDFRYYLGISMGSANEMIVHLKIATEVGYASQEESARFVSEYDVFGRQIHRLIDAWRKLEKRPTSNLQPPEDNS